MRLVRFTAKSFHDGRIVESGEEMLVADDVRGPHIVDVETGEQTAPTPPARPDAVFRGELASDIERSGPYARPAVPDDASGD